MTNKLLDALTIRGLGIAHGDTRVLDDINLNVPAGQVLALLGASGAGKTTLLRLVAGLLTPSEGQIEIAGKIVADPARGVIAPPEKRGLGMVFQDYALWPHLTVSQNVGFPLEMQRIPANQIKTRVGTALERVGLSAFAERRPSDLSGGQQQRVAIARAIVGEPPLVLFDEPLSNLDRELRENMVDELAALVADLNLSAVYVTHDHSEALALADQIAVMGNRGIEQLASPFDLIDQPRTAAVADFLRLGCLLPARRDGDTWVIEGTTTPLPGAGPDSATAQVLLPERGLSINGDGAARLPVEVRGVQVRSNGFALVLRVCGTDHDIRLISPQPAKVGARLELTFSPEVLRWFPPKG